MSDSRGPRSRGERLYRFLLFAYPRRFRRRYSADMLAFYRERANLASTRAAPGLLSVWLQLVPDLVASAIAERLAWLHREPDPAPIIIRVHSQRREDPMSILTQDIRYAFRGMVRRPGFTAVVLVTLALGIGANAAIFTVVNAVLLRPLPFSAPERIIEFTHGDPYAQVSEAEFVDYKREMNSLDRLAAFSQPTSTINAGDSPIRVRSARVSSDFFGVLGVAPMLGRTFTADEFLPSSKARVVVISHALWSQQLGGDSHIVGKAVEINGLRATVIGVMPASFTFPRATTTYWSPWRLNIDSLQARNNHYLRMVGRIARGSSIDAARTQARTLDAQWMHDYPSFYFPGRQLVAVVTPLPDYLFGPTRPYLLALLGAVGFILLIACVNVANLLLARGEGRRKEFAIRTALGASAGRVARQVLTESLVLAVIGAILGIALAWIGVGALTAVAPRDLPRIGEVGVDYRVIAFTTLITLGTGVLFGMMPALRGMRAETADTLREGGKASGQGGSHVARRSLVVAEVALAVVMVSGAGLLARSLAKLQSIDLGFERSRLLTMQLTLPPRKYSDTTAEAYFRQLVERTRGLAGVASAAAVSSLPITGDDNGWSILTDGRELKTVAEAATGRPEAVTPDYFRVMRIRVLRGRGLTDQDRLDTQPVVVISEGMGRQLWPGLDPIGHTIKMFSASAVWTTVVGVVADVRERGIQEEPPPTMYFPYSQATADMYYTPQSMTLLARTVGNPAAMTAMLRTVVRGSDPNVAISQVATMEQVVGDSIASRTFTTLLLGGFAMLALALAGVGIYGVISYGVSQRKYEIGVRVALGASRATILRMVMREGATMTLTGLAIGAASALLVDRLLNAMLVGVSAADAVTLSGTLLLLALVAASASLLPARRATTVSPTEALRE